MFFGRGVGFYFRNVTELLLFGGHDCRRFILAMCDHTRRGGGGISNLQRAYLEDVYRGLRSPTSRRAIMLSKLIREGKINFLTGA